MIYVPLLKTRDEEMRVFNNMEYCFSENMVPLIEILKDKYEYEFLVNPITKEYIYEQHGKTRRRAKERVNIITLDSIKDVVKDKPVFIDYFRFSLQKYSTNINVDNVELSLELNNNDDLYKKRIKEISKHPNMIPVVSIKDEFFMSKYELNKFLTELQVDNRSIALRITENHIEEYSDIINNTLRTSDYFLFDIGEQNPDSKFIELQEVYELTSNTKAILLNSPRKAGIYNVSYENGITKLINNNVKDMAKDYKFDGYGDYCGLADKLPEKGGGFAGAALSLIYDYRENVFHTYINPDTKQSMLGYRKIVPMILSDKKTLDPDKDCPALHRISEMTINGSGSWSTWKNITATRYIHQVYKYS